MPTHNDTSNDSELEPPSKSQRKRDMTLLQKMGETIVNLPKSKFTKLVLPPQLAKAIIDARAIENATVRRRQLQYIGKVMRNVDTDAIQKSLENIDQNSPQNNAKFQQLEYWREQLVTDTDAAFQQLLIKYPHLDRQYVNQLIRNIKKQLPTENAGPASKELFQYLKKLS
ncbi:ribosome biogenesis factor YjgA [soil metagenome]